MSVIGTQDSTTKPKSYVKICCKRKTKKSVMGYSYFWLNRKQRKSSKYLKKKDQCSTLYVIQSAKCYR